MKSSNLFFCAMVLTFAIQSQAAFLADIQPSRATLHNSQLSGSGTPVSFFNPSFLHQLGTLNQAGRVYKAWELLAEKNDGYALSASPVFADHVTLEKCVVESTWKVVVGDRVRERVFFQYAQLYQNHYIHFLISNDRFPNTLEIEKLYQRTDDELGLPQSVSIDLVLNLLPPDWRGKPTFPEPSQFVPPPTGEQRWFYFTGISDDRIASQSITAQGITVEEAKSIYKKTVLQIAKCLAVPQEENIYAH